MMFVCACLVKKNSKSFILKINYLILFLKDVEMKPDIDSPFLSGNWAVMIPIEWFSSSKVIFYLNSSYTITIYVNYIIAVQWIMQNRGTLDVLVHPNTGAEVSDHFSWLLK